VPTCTTQEKELTSIFASFDLSNLEKELQSYSFRQLIFEKEKTFQGLSIDMCSVSHNKLYFFKVVQ